MICLEQDADKDLFVFSSNRNNTALTHTHSFRMMFIYINSHSMYNWIAAAAANCSTFSTKSNQNPLANMFEGNYLNRLDLYVCFIHLRFRSNSAARIPFLWTYWLPRLRFFLPLALAFDIHLKRFMKCESMFVCACLFFRESYRWNIKS